MYSKGSKPSEQQVKDFAKSLGRDSVGVEVVNGKYRLIISREYSRTYYGKGQKRPSTGLSVLDSEGRIDKADADAISEKVFKMHIDLIHGYFDKSLIKYGLKEQPHFTVIESINKHKITMLELYDKYCEYRKKSLEITTYELRYKGTYRNSIQEAINAVGEDALKIRSWLLDNKAISTSRESLRHLSKAHYMGIKQKLVNNDPFDGMASELQLKKNKQRNLLDEDEESFEDDELALNGQKRGFTPQEMEEIIIHFRQYKLSRHYANLIEFLFLTGVRTNEGTALRWRDIKWEKECLLIRRSYSPKLKKFKGTKTGVARVFPMPQGGRLWNLLKTIDERDADDIVFRGRDGEIINNDSLQQVWKGRESRRVKGVIETLIEENKVSQYLPLYRTRHTFINIQINIHKIPRDIVSAWVGHDAMINFKRYWESDATITPQYGISSQEHDETTQVATNKLPSEVVKLLSGLKPEQIEQLRSLLNNNNNC